MRRRATGADRQPVPSGSQAQAETAQAAATPAAEADPSPTASQATPAATGAAPTATAAPQKPVQYGIGVSPKFTSVSSGFGNACGILVDGRVTCWGNNLYGSATPPKGIRLKSVHARSSNTCGLQTNGRAICWGGWTPDWSWGNSPIPSELANTEFLRLFDGPHTCGIKTDHTVACWGDGFFHAGDPPAGLTFSQIASGAY